MTTRADLVPCPFCGSPANLFDLAGWEVHCSGCGCQVCDVPTKDGAIAAWNRRALTAPAVSEDVDMPAIIKMVQSIRPTCRSVYDKPSYDMAIQNVVIALEILSEPKRHRWDNDGERCLDCGDKDWRADSVCTPSATLRAAIAPREERGDERAEFEKCVTQAPERFSWWADGIPVLDRDVDGVYVSSKARLAWAAWQARSSLSAQVGAGSLLRPVGSKPTRCYCPPDECHAPVVMGKQMGCLRQPPPHPQQRNK